MSDMTWEPQAEAALKRVPFFVRGLARGKVEERVRSRGGARVALADVEEAESRFRSAMGGKADADIRRQAPQPNEPGAELFVVETCHNEVSGCPNVLIRTADWAEAVRNWARENDISERLRARVKRDRILYHDKLRVSVAGCPNSCSRPQIAALGIVGFVRPEVDPEECTACGVCALACPDCAIAVEDGPPVFDRDACLGCLTCSRKCPQECIAVCAPGARILAGGKLGRHPRLAEVVAVVEGPAGAVGRIARMVGDYLERAGAGERFSDFWIRSRPGSGSGAQA